MKHSEEELQRKIESGNLHGIDEADIKAYQQVFNVLKKEPEFELPYGFADKIVKQALERRKARSSFGEHFWLGAGIFTLFIAAVITIAMIGYTFDFGFLKGLRSYTGVLLFGAAFVVALNFLEKKWLRPKNMA